MKLLLFKSNRARKSTAGTAALVVAAVVSASGVANAADPLVIEPGAPKVMTPADCAVSYAQAYVLDDLTLDGVDIAVTNANNVQIGGSYSDSTANTPVTVVITNGATWYANSKNFMFSRYGGTIAVSSTLAPVYDWSEPSKAGTIGRYGTLQNTQYAYKAGQSILRLLPNGVSAFRTFDQQCSNNVMCIQFEGGANYLCNPTSTNELFKISKDSRLLMESIDGKTIHFKGAMWNAKLFTGDGTLETTGDGDLLFDVDYKNNQNQVPYFEFGKDSNGAVVWGHGGKTCFYGKSYWKISADEILPHGVLLSGATRGPIEIGSSSSNYPTTLDLNGKTVAVNGLYKRAEPSNRHNVVTNSAATVATLGLDVPSASTNLSDVLTATFAADSSSTIKMRKIGAGTLTVDAALPDFAGLEVADGMLRFGANATVAGSFVCDNGAVQVDAGVTLDLSSIADADISISNLTVSATAGTITKFRPAENGILNIVGVVGDLPGIYGAQISLPAVVDAERFATWGVAVDGVVVRGATVSYANGALTAHLTHGLVILVR